MMARLYVTPNAASTSSSKDSSLMQTPPTSEDGHRKYAFDVALGSWILARQHAGHKVLDFKTNTPQPVLDIMHFFFNAGWGWGKVEHEKILREGFPE